MSSRSIGLGPVETLRESLQRLNSEAGDASLSTVKRKRLEAQVKEAIDQLTTIAIQRGEVLRSFK